MFSWYRELSGLERRTFWACFSGWTMDAMDAQIFSFLIPTLMVLWKVNSTKAGYLGTAALIATGVGGWVAGVLADRYGRVRIMQLAIIWFAFFTLLAGFVHSYPQMLVVRVFQGIGFGGEWGAGAVLMGEIIRPAHRGKAVGCVQSGYGIGWLLATLLSTAAFLYLPSAYAWRVLLWIGALPAVLVIFIQRNVQEPAIFLETKRARREEQPGIFAIFDKSIRRTTMLASLLALGVIGAGSSIIPWLPTFLKTVHHLSVKGVGTYMIFVTTGAFLGFVGSAYLSDRVGRRKNFLIFSGMSWLVTLGYMFLPLGYWSSLLLCLPFGFFTQGSYASLGPYFTELFPTAIRGAGQAFSYNFGKGIGAFCVAGVGFLAGKIQLGEAIGAVSLVAYLLAITATLLLPETRGIELSPGAGVSRSVDSRLNSPQQSEVADWEAVTSSPGPGV
jgi:MFS family permease